MKNIYKAFLGSALAMVAFASCDSLNEAPVFDASESFAAFSSTSVSITETGGQVVIPVSLAAYEPLKTNVSYSIIDCNSADSKYSAAAGVDFVDTNADAVLTFDGTQWSQDIVIDIVPHTGSYTGDLTFAVKLESAKGLKLSAENTIVVTISDLDHPLASILGAYTATSTNTSGGTDTWTVNLTKDQADVHVVHIDYIVKGALDYKSWGDWSYVGTVSDDLKTITVARGQKTQAWYQSEEDQFILKTFQEFGDGSISGISSEGNFEITETAPGKWSVGNIWLYPAVTQKYYSNFMGQNITWTKQ